MAAVRGFSLGKLASVRMIFSVFDSRSTSTREFMRRVTAARVRETNSKCDVTHEVRGDQTPPTVQVRFTDGSEFVLEGASHTALDIIAAINRKSRTL
ncbi:39S ribosomal protein L53, mitochondrial [Geodia barretti]|uniref:Large ribosomal subunit protein mL53 n=1 Tax=Geodia barretti TaxID=519541 RepID=A0AA35SNG6_GEOBA|nr:39S ribosomal protein L53, mitochondrial [Geodia barretti]